MFDLIVISTGNSTQQSMLRDAYRENQGKSDPRFSRRPEFVSSSQNSQKRNCSTPLKLVNIDSKFDEDKRAYSEKYLNTLLCYMSKMVTRVFATFSDVVDEALKLEQLAAVKRDAQERAAIWERREVTLRKLINPRSETNAQAASDASPTTSDRSISNITDNNNFPRNSLIPKGR